MTSTRSDCKTILICNGEKIVNKIRLLTRYTTLYKVNVTDKNQRINPGSNLLRNARHRPGVTALND